MTFIYLFKYKFIITNLRKMKY